MYDSLNLPIDLHTPEQLPPQGAIMDSSSPPPPLSRKAMNRGLRRPASDQFLVLHQTLSRASSLGDDSRFENVSGQVNSRLKAIRDSWQDANLRLPSIPSIPILSIPSSLTDLTRRRASSSKEPIPALNRQPMLRPLSATEAHAHNAKRKPRAAGIEQAVPSQHSFFARALQNLSGDLVILGGYRGSILRSAEPPHRQLWVPIKVGLNLRKVDLEVGLNREDEDTMEQHIIPGGMLTHIGPVDISRRLLKRLRASPNAMSGKLRIHEYSYDWRLSPHLLSTRLVQYLEGLPCNQLTTPNEKRGALVIAHSLGGLISRHAINQRPELFSGIIYAGTPNACVNILGPLRKGDDVLFSSRVLTAQVNFTIRTSFALLPLDGRCFIDKHTKEEYPIDFFNVESWINHALSPVIATPLPPLKDATQSGITGVFSSMANVLPNLSGFTWKGSISKANNARSFQYDQEHANDEMAKTAFVTESVEDDAGVAHTGTAPRTGKDLENWTMGSSNPATAVTLPRNAAIAYLARTLAEVKRFKQELLFRPERADSASNQYPPIAVVYGKSVPTVCGARVTSLEHVRHTDCYDDLVFASGDGVVLARAAQVPDGYSVVREGCISSDRGHLTLLGDLEAIGRCLSAVMSSRSGGVGLGLDFHLSSKGTNGGDDSG